LNTVENIYDEAEANLPQVKGAEYFLKSRERELAIMTRGQLSPSLALRGLFYSRYSELATDPIRWWQLSIYRIRLRIISTGNLGISLQIPIFNGWSTRNRISNAHVSVLDAQISA
jgi:outer membrane protein